MITGIESLLLGFMSIEVSPEVLFSESEKLLREASAIRIKFERIKNTVSSTSTYWQGSVSNRERKEYEDKYSEILKMINKIESYGNELKVISQNYVDAESASAEEAQSLPIDIIS